MFCLRLFDAPVAATSHSSSPPRETVAGVAVTETAPTTGAGGGGVGWPGGGGCRVPSLCRPWKETHSGVAIHGGWLWYSSHLSGRGAQYRCVGVAFGRYRYSRLVWW